MEKIDFVKAHPDWFRPPKTPAVVEMPPLNFLMINGQGNPNTAQEYQDALQALYAVAYNLKFTVKKAGILDYRVPPLQGLWWAEDMTAFTVEDQKDEWLWTMMIMQPPLITLDQVNTAIQMVQNKKNPVALPKLRFDTYHEGLAVQVMYIGPYADEGPTIAGLHQYAKDNGYHLHGKHHEIYLGDPRRTAPERLKTVIRQPVTQE